MRICVFEDGKFSNLYPLSLTRPVFDLVCGHTKLSEKISRNFRDAEIVYSARSYIVPVFAKSYKLISVDDISELKNNDCLFINGRLLYKDVKIETDGKEEIAKSGETVVYVRIKKENFANAGNSIVEIIAYAEANLQKTEIKAVMIDFPWNLIHYNPECMNEDFRVAGKTGMYGKLHELSTVMGDNKSVFVAEGVDIQPFCVLDATHGSIYIEEGVVVFPHSRIEGPCYIGKKTQIVGTNLREGCSIGPTCRVGGEVEESIIHGYSNKYHAGFLGHSYLGEWVNIGAMGSTSDLKNDYSGVQVYMNGKLMDSGDIKVGSFIGDHTKFGMGCLMITGFVAGTMSNILPTGKLTPKYIPSFCWFYDDVLSKGKGLKDMISTAEMVMSRRKVKMTEEEKEMYRHVFEITKEERDALIEKIRKKAK